MTDADLGEYERREILAHVERVLRDLGYPEPPLFLPDVRQLLKLDLNYYSSSDTGFVAELAHRARLLMKKTLPEFSKHLLNALAKSKLCAFWVPDTRKILIDQDVPQPKHRWMEAHEISHSITPWHRDFLLGDNKEMLDPTCHAIIESESNFGAGRLIFLQDRFGAEARELDLSFDSVQQLARRYKNTITSTLWHFVEDREPDRAVFGMIGIHPFHPEIGAHDGPEPWRYFIRSARFKTQFSNVTPNVTYQLIKDHASWKRKGPILSAQDVLVDVNGDVWEFQMESFSNSYALLTYGAALQKRPVTVAVASEMNRAGIRARRNSDGSV
jgi:hypothetical protein